jgi:hypothetical protein
LHAPSRSASRLSSANLNLQPSTVITFFNGSGPLVGDRAFGVWRFDRCTRVLLGSTTPDAGHWGCRGLFKPGAGIARSLAIMSARKVAKGGCVDASRVLVPPRCRVMRGTPRWRTTVVVGLSGFPAAWLVASESEHLHHTL